MEVGLRFTPWLLYRRYLLTGSWVGLEAVTEKGKK
jgi:hypothetical protein